MYNWIAERDAGKPPRKRRKWSKYPESAGADAMAQELPSIPATGLDSKSLEFFFHRDWRGVSMEEFMSRLNDYPVFYNERRVKETLGWLSPSACRRSPGLAA